jgi:hypothetical protein
MRLDRVKRREVINVSRDLTIPESLLLKRLPLKLNCSSTVMRGLDRRIHLLALPGQARSSPAMTADST